MKKTKKIISLFLTIQMLFACALIPSAIATDSVIETSVVGSESPEELTPLMARGCGMTSPQAREAAAALGYTVVANEYCHGQLVFYNSSRTPHYISADTEGHIGGVWKGANTVEGLWQKSTRLGTYDAGLNRIGD